MVGLPVTDTASVKSTFTAMTSPSTRTAVLDMSVVKATLLTSVTNVSLDSRSFVTLPFDPVIDSVSVPLIAYVSNTVVPSSP